MALPVVQVNVWSGMTLENKKKMVEGITRVLEGMGIPKVAVAVLIREEPKENGLRPENYTQKDSQIKDLNPNTLSHSLPLIWGYCPEDEVMLK